MKVIQKMHFFAITKNTNKAKEVYKHSYTQTFSYKREEEIKKELSKRIVEEGLN